MLNKSIDLDYVERSGRMLLALHYIHYIRLLLYILLD